MRVSDTGRRYLSCLLFVMVTQLGGLCLQAEGLKQVSIHPGQSTVMDFPTPIKRVSIANPDIADASVTSSRQILINGKAVGKTSLVIWDESEKYEHYKLVVVDEASEHQITLEVKFAEVNRSALKELGFDYWIKNIKSGSDLINAGSFAGKVGAPNDPLLLGNTVDFFLSIPTQNITTIIKALEEKNLLSILARPNLSAIDGAEASFLAGGEFPIPIVSGAAGMQSVSIQFKEFGVKLKFVPTVLDTGLIRIKTEAEVSKLDFENGITLSGFRIPALTTRKAQTVVELSPHRFLIIGGLINNEMAKTISRVPILGQIPLLGMLFRSSRFLNNESELLIFVSPSFSKVLREDELKNRTRSCYETFLEK